MRCRLESSDGTHAALVRLVRKERGMQLLGSTILLRASVEAEVEGSSPGSVGLPERGWIRRALRWLEGLSCVLLLAGLLAACRPGPGQAPESGASDSESLDPVHYVFPGVTGPPVESTTHRGRATVLLFITTFDVFSQAQASRLEDLFRSREPRINAAAIVVEAPRNAELVTAFVEVLDLSYAVAMTESRTLSEHTFFRNIRAVPAWVFFDASGRPQAVGSGALSLDRLNEVLDGFTPKGQRARR